MAKFDSKFSDAKISPGFLLWKVSNLHQRLQKKALEPLDLTPSQFSVLACYFFLLKKTESVSQADLCSHAGIDKMLVSDLTKTLLKKGFVKSSKNKTDRRSFDIAVTDEGIRTCNKALKIIEALDANFFGQSPRQADFLEIMQELANSETGHAK
jgi:DNA-binding MarR family transcriptional regulator